MTAVSQAVTMIAGGVLALLVAIRIGNNASTDGFFAAYGAYTVAVLFAQSMRTTIVARIVEPGAFDRYVGAVVVLFAGFGVAFAALGDPLAGLLTGGRDVAHDTARTALLILWPAVGGQLFGSLAAAMLGTRGDFTTPAIAFGGGGAVSIAGFLALEGQLGIDALPMALLAGSTLTGAILGAALLRSGWRPDVRATLRLRDGARAARLMVLSSLPFLLAQLGFLVTLAVAARLGEGVVTVYSYSYAAVGLMMAFLAAAPTVVLAGPLAVSWDRRPESLLPHHRAVWVTGLLLFTPIVAAAALVGEDLARLVLAKFTDEQARLTIELFLFTVPVVVWALAGGLVQTALFTLGRYRTVAGISAVFLLVQIAISVLAAVLESADLMAAAVSIAAGLAVPVTLWALSPDYLREAGPMLVWGLVRILGLGALCFGILGLLLPGPAALTIGLVLFTAVVGAAFPYERSLGLRMLSVFRRRVAAPPSPTAAP